MPRGAACGSYLGVGQPVGLGNGLNLFIDLVVRQHHQAGRVPSPSAIGVVRVKVTIGAEITQWAWKRERLGPIESARALGELVRPQRNIAAGFTQAPRDDVIGMHVPKRPRVFSLFVTTAQSKLASLTRGFDPSDEDQWREVQDTRHSFVNILVGAAKRYGIDELASWQIPRIDDFGNTDYRQFQADIDHYVTQLAIGHSLRDRRDSVPVPQQSKEKIRDYLRALRECIEKADLSDAKRANLLDRLDEFEKELERRRLTLLALTKLMISIAVVPGGLWASYEITNRLLANVMQIVGEARAADEENRPMPTLPEETPKLSPPRADERKRPSRNAPAFDTGGMDDDIPF